MAAKKNKLCERVRSTFSEIRVFERGYVSKKQGLNYVKWSYALECLKTAFPDSDVSWREWDGLDHLLYPSGSAIVEAIITIRDGGEELVTKFPLPVLDHRNKAIVNPNAMDVNTAKMRAFVKAMSTLGFGLNVYHGHGDDGIADNEADAEVAGSQKRPNAIKEAFNAEVAKRGKRRKAVAPGGGHYPKDTSPPNYVLADPPELPNYVLADPPGLIAPTEAIKDLKRACDDEGIDFGLVEDFVQMKRGVLVTELASADIAGLKTRVMNDKDKFRKDK